MMDYPSLFLKNDSIQKVFFDKMSHKQAENVTCSKYKCDLCEYKTTKKELMRQHTLVKHSGTKHKCPNCAYTHYYPGKVRSHFQEVHLKEKRSRDEPKDCFEKGCTNTQKEVCKELGHNKLVCKQCDYRAFAKGTMRNHVRNKHEGKEGRLFSCNQCDFKNESRGKVDIHTARIHDGVVYRCKRCDLVMTSKGSLKFHNYFHHSDKTFQCDRCDYKCGNKSVLNKHRRKVHKTNFQTEADENDDSYEEDGKVNIEEEKIEILVGKPLQQCDAGKPKAPIDEHMGMLIECNDCSYLSQNENISKLHLLSHRYSEAEIIDRFPPALKNLEFSSEEEFSKNLNLLLQSLSAKGNKKD